MAELNTSGEIRVHLEAHCNKPNVLDRAAELFAKLDMHKTLQRNGVLIYMAIDDHKFAIIGDAGINAAVGAGFWEREKGWMAARLEEGKIVEGLVEGIEEVGQKLKQFFPYMEDDVNELSDDISYGH